MEEVRYMKPNVCNHLSVKECLKDAGCSKETIQSIMDCIQNNQHERKIMLLKEHRYQLLEKIHHDQKQIDCLDYLLYQLKQVKNQ